MPFTEPFFSLSRRSTSLGRDMADLDRAGDRGEVGRRRGDLPVEDHDRDAGGAGLLDEGCSGVEIDRGQDDRRGLQRDHVVHLALLQVGLVVGVERHDLVADVLHELGDGVDRVGLEFVQQRRHHVVDLALRLGGGGVTADRRERRSPATAAASRIRFIVSSFRAPVSVAVRSASGGAAEGLAGDHAGRPRPGWSRRSRHRPPHVPGG